MPDNDPSSITIAASSAGLAVVGALTVGFGGVMGSFLSVFAGDFVASGIFLSAAGISFGLLANAIYRQ